MRSGFWSWCSCAGLTAYAHRCASVRLYLELLQLSVGHGERRDRHALAAGLHAKGAERHAAAQRLTGLRHLGRRAEWTETGCIVGERLRAEVGIGVGGEQRTIDLAALECREHRARLRDRLCR